MATYDQIRFDPPAPVAEVTISSLGGQVTDTNVLLLIDTGADLTLLPASCTDGTELTPGTFESCELAGFDGQKSAAKALQADVILLGMKFRGKYVLLEDEEVGILGRDLLNHIRLLLDGPNLEWDVPVS